MKDSAPSSELALSEYVILDLRTGTGTNPGKPIAEVMSVGDGAIETEDSVTVSRENVEQISTASSASALARRDELDTQEAMSYSQID